MNSNKFALCLSTLALAGLAGCSSKPPVKQAAAAPDKIQGKAQIQASETSEAEAAFNAGGPSVYLVDGLNRYRLFFNKSFPIEAGKEYVAEGVYAQKAIDAMGDPDQGKNGYPLDSSCSAVVRMAWPGLSFDDTDAYASNLRAKVKRFPARPIFLVTQIEPAPSAGDSGKKEEAAAEKEAPSITVPADKQSALLTEGPTTLPAPLWEPTGGTARCKVVIDEKGKISELDSGSQLCETVPWAKFSYKPTLRGGKAVKVDTEVEVHFDPRK